MTVFFVLQVMNIVYSLNNVLIKVVADRWEKDKLFHFCTLSILAGAFIVLAIYAILWQRILSKVDLSVAYMCKGMIIFWGMLWAFMFFNEHISIYNILGSIIIFIGTYLVTLNE